MRSVCLLLLCFHGIFAQLDTDPLYSNNQDISNYYYYDGDTTGTPFQPPDQVHQQNPQQQQQLQLQLDPIEPEPQQQQRQQQQEIIAMPTMDPAVTEPTEPGPLDCREEQYPCTRLYSVHKPCKQCLNEICFYSLRRMYVINKEICVRTVCAHEELLRADLCRDKFSRCGVMANSGLCQSMGSHCSRSCGSC
ncbi:microfibril associated protein 2 S homeolog precursor [Xenopus laevis]|uniref:MGC82952 protein n=1 Tax=Xenopus laevis TaxID=8355 RepID=Q68F14_XENLA|nr:microfibril associated protein 2 S homeolog precursor [Xenopus laevis]AAH80032.1 MGC82952 protein [Xenopus laevis]